MSSLARGQRYLWRTYRVKAAVRERYLCGLGYGRCSPPVPIVSSSSDAGSEEGVP